MKTKHIFSEEEFEIIKKAITESLQLWSYPLIEASDGEGRSVSMSAETFLRDLKRELNVTPSP